MPTTQKERRGGVNVLKYKSSRTRAEPQQIEAQRPLSCLQYPVLS
jgi:hypothetical protein